MFKRFAAVGSLWFFTLLFHSSAGAVMIPLEGALESLEIELVVSSDGRGQASGRQCAKCELKRFTVSPKSRFYRGQKQLSLPKARALNGRSGTIFYDLESNDVTRILW